MAIPSGPGNIFEVIRVYLLVSFMALPLMLTGFTGIFALGLSNLGMFMLFLAQTIVVPIIVTFAQFVHKLALGDVNSLISVTASDVCQLVPSVPASTRAVVAPSIWIAEVVLSMTYLFYNAIQVYYLPAETGANEQKVENRKARSLSVMVVTAITLVAILVIRFALHTGCETWYGGMLGVIIGAGVGVGWYEFARTCGIRHADVFGIVAKMLPPGASAPPPKMCVYSGSA